MFTVDVDTIRRRLARNWAKCQSMQGPFVYRLSDKRVINNKPHITLTTYQQQQAPQMYSLASLFAQPSGGSDEVESSDQD